MDHAPPGGEKIESHLGTTVMKPACAVIEPSGVIRSIAAAILLLAGLNCAGGGEVRSIQFSGYKWYVKDSGGNAVGPGPNRFSDSEKNVRLDDKGRLHLGIRKSWGKWYCAEVWTEESFGNGIYIFTVAPGADRIDPQAVLGMFVYDMNAEEEDYRELDIELSRWGHPNFTNAQFAIQGKDYGEAQKRFNFVTSNEPTTHVIEWFPISIYFKSVAGRDYEESEDEKVFETWRHRGFDVPGAGSENVRINLWLYEGNKPLNSDEVEVIIESFRYISFDDL